MDADLMKIRAHIREAERLIWDVAEWEDATKSRTGLARADFKLHLAEATLRLAQLQIIARTRA